MLALVWVLGVCGTARSQELQKDVAALIGRARLGSAAIGVCVLDVESGKVLAAYHENDRLIPASNLKLLTSASAISVLGPGYEFRTQIERHGDRLVIRGAGDPAFADPVLLEQMNTSLDAFIDRLAESVTKSGMKRCDEIVVDDRVFDRTYIHPDWPKDQLDKGYCAEVLGLNFHANVLRIYASPGSRDSELGTLTTEPAGGGIEVKCRVRTVRGANRNTAIGAVRGGDENVFTISGTVNAPLQEPAETTLHEASLVFAELFAEHLARAGVRRGGDQLAGGGGAESGAAACRLAGADEEFGGAGDVLAVVRTPLSVVLERCNQDSENLYAESLAKLLGHKATGQPGSWSNGTSAVRMQVRDRLGPEAAAVLLLADGSGMSRANKVTASLLAHWLANIARDPVVGPVLIDSLPRARAEGTMRRRFLDKSPVNEVRGKSGLLNGVRSLSGYVTDPGSGHRVAYSIIVNDIPSDVSGAKVKDFHEDVVMAVDRWLSKQGGDDVQERLGGGETKRKK
jgi:D-alanyl-D-alanine carboxypeptidase/D-alanyl-D-alanine-endopeptidase (penicillin-binding protein 4)